MYPASLAFGFVLAFTRTTLAIGKPLGDTGVGSGYQNAITPPTVLMFTMLVYALLLGGLIYGFWAFGWLVGVAVAVELLVQLGDNLLESDAVQGIILLLFRHGM